MRFGLRSGLAVAALITAGFAGGAASAATITYAHTSEFSGSGSALSGPVLATFDDSVAVDTVRLTIDTSAWDGSLSEYVAGFYFNSDVVGMTATSVTMASASTTVSQGFDSFKADGDGFFDVQIDFATSGSGDRFVAGETEVIDFTAVGLTIANFDFVSVDGPVGKTGFYTTVRARSLDADGSGSGWFNGEECVPGTPGCGGGGGFEVPLPAGLPLLLSALGMGAFLHRRARKSA